MTKIERRLCEKLWEALRDLARCSETDKHLYYFGHERYVKASYYLAGMIETLAVLDPEMSQRVDDVMRLVEPNGGEFDQGICDQIANMWI